MNAKLEPPVSIAIISMAMYHGHFWAQAISDSSRASLVGIWDDDAERGSAAAAQYETRFEPDLSALLERCDAVCITSETARHAEFVERAAAKGCHILCEKPLATTLADCDRIEAAVTKAGVTFMQSYPKRFDPINHEVKRLVDSGELGRITLMRVRHGHLYGLLKGNQHGGWTNDPVLSGGGSLLDEGCHGADLIRWLFGDPHSVMATVSSAALGHAVEDFGLAVFMYPDGPVCELAASVTFAAGDNSVEVFGTRGSAIISGVDLASRDVTDSGFLKVCILSEENLSDPTTRRWQVSPLTPGFKTTPKFHQLNPLEFIDALVEGRPAANSMHDGRRSLEMILCAYQAAAAGQTVTIPSSK